MDSFDELVTSYSCQAMESEASIDKSFSGASKEEGSYDRMMWSRVHVLWGLIIIANSII